MGDDEEGEGRKKRVGGRKKEGRKEVRWGMETRRDEERKERRGGRKEGKR